MPFIIDRGFAEDKFPKGEIGLLNHMKYFDKLLRIRRLGYNIMRGSIYDKWCRDADAGSCTSA